MPLDLSNKTGAECPMREPECPVPSLALGGIGKGQRRQGGHQQGLWESRPSLGGRHLTGAAGWGAKAISLRQGGLCPRLAPVCSMPSIFSTARQLSSSGPQTPTLPEAVPHGSPPELGTTALNTGRNSSPASLPVPGTSLPLAEGCPNKGEEPGQGSWVRLPTPRLSPGAGM